MLVDDRSVAAAIGDLDNGADVPDEVSRIPELEAPKSLRPCCAFGVDLQVKLGEVVVPGVSLSNVIGTQDIGPHGYDNGYITLAPGDDRGWVRAENNGLVYTCRGGFIDTAHIRDNADMTMFLITMLARHLETGGIIRLPDQGGKIAVKLDPVLQATIQRYGRWDLAGRAAVWVAFQVSIWHEIASWYGHSTLAAWPEKLSAFSPEDLYSNLLGAKLARGIASNRLAGSDAAYNRAMDAWLLRVLERLEVVPREDAVTAMKLVDGLWWDSSRRIPDWKLTLRRNSDIGPEIAPWLASEATGLDRERAASFTACNGAGRPLVLSNPSTLGGVEFSARLTLEIRLNGKIARALGRDDGLSRIITQDDFPSIVATIREENEFEMGQGANAR